MALELYTNEEFRESLDVYVSSTTTHQQKLHVHISAEISRYLPSISRKYILLNQRFSCEYVQRKLNYRFKNVFRFSGQGFFEICQKHSDKLFWLNNVYENNVCLKTASYRLPMLSMRF